MRHPLADRGGDVYETPVVAVDTLLGAERLPAHIWEPACGPGAIVSVLRERGFTVTATDLTTELPDATSGVDFLMERHAPPGVEAIVTNPPFKLAGKFVEHALKLVPLVVMLLRVQFLESAERGPLFDRGVLARVRLFRDRLPMMHRDGWSGQRLERSPFLYAWYVFEREHQGPPTLHWLVTETAKPKRVGRRREEPPSIDLFTLPTEREN
jgi:hypothetical protein